MADFFEVREQYHRALETYILGDPTLLWSTRDDVSLAIPSGLRSEGGTVREAAEPGASQLRDGEAFSLECISAYATTDPAYEVNIERSRVTVFGAAMWPRLPSARRP